MNFTNNNNGNGYGNGYNNGYNNGNSQFNQNMFGNQNGYNNGYNQYQQPQYNQYQQPQYQQQQFNQFSYNNGQTSNQQNSFMNSFANPRLRSLSKHAGEYSEEGASTFNGIAAKTLYFVLVFALGLAAFFILHSSFAKSGVAVDGSGLLYQQEIYILVGASILTLIAGLVTAFVPRMTALFGTIYCVGMGYMVTLVSYGYAQQYKGIVFEALGLTLLIIGVLTVLYSKGVIRVTNRFRKVVYTTLIVSLLASLIFMLVYFIAPNSSFVTSIIEINNGPIGIVFAVLGVALASAILTIDFDNAAQTVQQGLPKMYEWVASFGLVTGVIYLYLKVLRLLAKIQNNR